MGAFRERCVNLSQSADCSFIQSDATVGDVGCWYRAFRPLAQRCDDGSQLLVTKYRESDNVSGLLLARPHTKPWTLSVGSSSKFKIISFGESRRTRPDHWGLN